jgi:hypothetical protein
MNANEVIFFGNELKQPNQPMFENMFCSDSRWYVSAAFWPSKHRFRMDDEHNLGTWLIECWGIIPSINGFVTFCNYGYEPLKWGTLQLYFWHSQCFSSRSWQSWAKFQHPVIIPSHPPTETPILHNVCSISKLTQSYAAFYKPLRNVHGNLEWAPSFRPQPSPADVDEAKALSKTGDEVHHGRWE